MGQSSEEWVFTVLCVGAFALGLFLAFALTDLNRVLTGQGRYPSSGETPVRLPLAAFTWTVCTAVAFYGWREAENKSLRDKSVLTSGGGLNNAGYFSLGWSDGLFIFGIRIDTWWRYTIVLCYLQVRAVLASLMNALYSPWLSSSLYSAGGYRPPNRGAMRALLIGQAATTTAAWWSSITNVVTSTTQFDLAVVALLTSVAADASLAEQNMMLRFQEAEDRALAALKR